ncbi:pre-mRNA-splicing regulator WTAP-like [Convolutriloba macropyga]|uniref:pre-mRNA-splicing regulator WTAP-like n=1 Tax=Convolutriloba macropyga TaxID=536237 RepID=UPI003F5212F1
MEELYTSEIKKISINDDTLNCMNATTFLKFWKLQNEYLNSLEAKVSKGDAAKSAILEKLKELSRIQSEIESSKRSSSISSMDFTNYPLDPMVYDSISALNEDLTAKKRLQKVLETDLQNCSYTPDNKVGKLLIAKCRQLSEENRELQEEINQGILPQSEAEVCLQKQQKAQLLSEFKDYSEISTELEHELKDSQHKLSEVQGCYKTLFREEAAVISAQAAAEASSQNSYSSKNGNSYHRSSHKTKSAKYDDGK